MGTEALGRSLTQDRLLIASQYAFCMSLLSAVSCARGTPGESMQQAVAQDLADVWRLWARSVCVLRGAGQVDQCTRMGREQRGSRVAGRLGRLGRGVACVADWRRTGFEICIGAHSSIWRAGGGIGAVSISAMRAVVAVMRAFISGRVIEAPRSGRAGYVCMGGWAEGCGRQFRFNSKYYVVHRTLRLAATARLRSII